MHRLAIRQRSARRWLVRIAFGLHLAGVAVGCDDRRDERPALTLGAYTVPREAYGTIVPAFRDTYRTKTGRTVEVRASYLGSGAQARAIAGGFEADVAALSLEPDIQSLVETGLVEPTWNDDADAGIVTRSIVVIGVRAGNPEGIHDWADLARPGLDVLTPNVRTSGGAMWNVTALYGAAIRGHAGVPAGDPKAAVRFVASVLRNVWVMDRSGRDSMLTFERGVGDAIITYENEIIVGRLEGKRYDYVVPRSTVLIENPVAVVDGYADRHGTRAIAEAFVAYLRSPPAQEEFARYGLRPVRDDTASAYRFEVPSDLFTVKDLGGWPRMQDELFGPGGRYERALLLARAAAHRADGETAP